MARRAHTAEQELPFVALMDTMTNVVGVLTIVLVMIGISLASAVNKVISALPPATPEQIRDAQRELERIQAAQKPDKDRLDALNKQEPASAQLSIIDKEIARLESSARDKSIKLFDVESAEKERARREEELKQKRSDMDQLLAEREKLKALLDATPVYKPPPAKVVRIPASRPIPQGANVEHIVVSQFGAHWIDVQGVKEQLLREFKSSAMRDTVARRVKRGDQTVAIYDHEKITRYFATRKPLFREFRLEVEVSPITTRPMVRMTPVARPSLGLSSTLRQLLHTPKTVVMFHVPGDAFEQYLAARDVCDDIGVPAGWEYAGKPEHVVYVGDIETTKPKRAQPPPKPGAPAEIKRPQQTLD